MVKIEQATNSPLTYTEAIPQLYACNFGITHRLIQWEFAAARGGILIVVCPFCGKEGFGILRRSLMYEYQEGKGKPDRVKFQE